MVYFRLDRRIYIQSVLCAFGTGYNGPEGAERCDFPNSASGSHNSDVKFQACIVTDGFYSDFDACSVPYWCI